jgi:hypothetical protein
MRSFWTVVELYRFTEMSLRAVRGIGDCRRQILRGFLRAATALTHVEASRQVEWNLSRARAAIDDAEAALLVVQHLVADDVVDAVMVHIDRVVAEIALLTRTASATTAGAPTEASKATGSTDAPNATSVIAQITERMSAVLRSRWNSDEARTNDVSRFSPSSRGSPGDSSEDSRFGEAPSAGGEARNR